MSVILLHCFSSNCACHTSPLRFVRDLIGIAHGALVSTFTGLYEWLMAYCLNGTGKKAIAGFKKTSPFHILCIFEVKQSVNYKGYLPRLFTTRQTFSMCCGSMNQCVKRWAIGCLFFKPIESNYSLTYGLHRPPCFHKVVHLPKETSLLSHDHCGLSHHLFLFDVVHSN